MTEDFDKEMMRKALELAAQVDCTSPNPRVGCVIVKNKKIIGQGWHSHYGAPHAEAMALASLKPSMTNNSTMYVTLEPCQHYGNTPPCIQTLIKAGIQRVVIASSDPNPLMRGKSIESLRKEGMTIEVGLYEQEAYDLNVGFFHRHTYQRPWIRSKIAMSLDGKISLKNGQSQWITDKLSRIDGKKWRKRACILITGSNTIRYDNPLFYDDITDHASSCLILNTQADLLKNIEKYQIFTCDLNRKVILCHADDIAINTDIINKYPWISALPSPRSTTEKNKLDLGYIVQQLAKKKINEVHVESGSTVNQTLLDEKLIDEYLIYIAPCLLGDTAKSGLISKKPPISMQEVEHMQLYTIDKIGNNICMRLRHFLEHLNNWHSDGQQDEQ